MENYYQKSGSKFTPDIFSTPTRERQRPTTPIYLLQQSNEEQYVKNLMTNLSSYLTTKEPNYDNLGNLLLPKDVNYYYTERTKVLEMIDRCYSRQKQTIEELMDEFLKQLIVLAETAKSEIFEVIENEKKAHNDFYEKFSAKVEGFLEQSGYKINNSMQTYKNYVNNMGREFADPLEFELSRIKLEKRRFEEIEAIFNIVRKDYGYSSIPEQKKVLEMFFSESRLPNSKVDAELIKANLKALIDSVSSKVKELHRDENSLKARVGNIRPVSNSLNNNLQSSMLQRLNNYTKDRQTRVSELTPIRNLDISKSPRQPTHTKESETEHRPSSVLNINLLNSDSKMNKDVMFKMPEPEKEHDKVSSLADKLKSNNINININNIPYNNNHFINVYNQQNQLRQGAKPGPARDYYNTNKIDLNTNLAELRAKRPASSIVGSQPNQLNTSQNGNSSFSRNNGRSLATVISMMHTNLFTKFSVPCSKYKSDIIINDYLSNITCFEVSTEGCDLFYGTKNGDIIACKVNTELAQTVDVRKTRFSHPVLFIAEVNNHLLVSLDAKNQNLMLLDSKSLSVVVDYKTCNEKIKLVAYHTAEKFFAINCENRLFLYEVNKSSPVKSFRVTDLNIVDAVMASNNLLYTATENGEIKSFKVSFETNSMALEGKLDIHCKVKGLEVFHNNEKLLIVNAERNNRSEVVIINFVMKKIMNTITDPNQDHIASILTFTIVKRPPEILLLALGSNRMSYCDIDKPTLDNEITVEGGKKLSLKPSGNLGVKVAKILTQELKTSTYVIGFNSSGLNLIKFY